MLELWLRWLVQSSSELTGLPGWKSEWRRSIPVAQKRWHSYGSKKILPKLSSGDVRLIMPRWRLDLKISATKWHIPGKA